MPLADVLSALRVVILDDFGAVPADATERLSLFAKKFPRLTQEELEDLASVPPDRFEIYTSTIFSGNRGVLKNHFQLSFALIESIWPQIEGTKFSGFELVKKIHALKPWKTNTTEGLALNFIDYINDHGTSYTKLLPFLGEVAQLELETLRLKRDKEDTSLKPKLEENLSISVAQFLETPFTLTALARPRSFNFDVISYRIEFYDLNYTLPQKPPQEKATYAVGGRTRELYSRWVKIGESTFDFLRLAAPGNVHQFSELAEAVICDAQSSDEQEQFLYFYRTAQALEQINAIKVL